MNSSERQRKARNRIIGLLSILALLVAASWGIERFAFQTASLAALPLPPTPRSPYTKVNPDHRAANEVRLRSEPLLPAFEFVKDPYRREICAFELGFIPPLGADSPAILYFDTRKADYNPFGDEMFAGNESLEAHRVYLVEVPREDVMANHERSGFNRRHELSRTKRLFDIRFARHEPIGAFQFVLDEGANPRHLLRASRRAVSGTARAYPLCTFTLWGKPAPQGGPLPEPIRLAGYHSDRRGGMNRASFQAATSTTGSLALDHNLFSMDEYGDPTGMVTQMAAPTMSGQIETLDLVDPTREGRSVLRFTPIRLLTPAAKRLPFRGNYFGGVPFSTNAVFDVVVAPYRNGRHRLLIWETNVLKKWITLRD